MPLLLLLHHPACHSSMNYMTYGTCCASVIICTVSSSTGTYLWQTVKLTSCQDNFLIWPTAITSQKCPSSREPHIRTISSCGMLRPYHLESNLPSQCFVLSADYTLRCRTATCTRLYYTVLSGTTATRAFLCNFLTPGSDACSNGMEKEVQTNPWPQRRGSRRYT